jgi:hypothetical protein
VSLTQQNGPESWSYFGGQNANGLPSTQTSVLFDVDTTAAPSAVLISGMTYNWSVQVQDIAGDTAQLFATYVVP